jgi:hypothetical protein
LERDPRAVLAAVAGSRWISLASLDIFTASMTPTGLALGPQVFGNGAQFVVEGDRMSIVREGWRIEAFRRFRPLVYFAAFGEADVFECLRLAVGSLFEFGAYDGDVLLLTDEAHREWAATLPEAVRPRVHVRTVSPAADVLDWTLARYRLVGLEGMRAYRPVLYLDIDVVCNASLIRLLQRLAVSTMVHAPAESPLMRADNTYGASLFEADRVVTPPQRLGFTTGIMGFPDVQTAHPLFSLVPVLAEGYAREAGTRVAFPTYDQAFANYAAVKMGGVETNLMRHFLDNVHFWQARPPTRLGLTHFTGGTHAATPKVAAMTAYVEKLRCAVEARH